MTRVQQCLLVVCVSIFVIFGNSAFATKIQNVEGNLQATVLVSTKKITAQVDETTGNLPPVPMTPGNPGLGTGIIISKDGYIITNYHVIEQAITSPAQISVWTYEDESMTEYVATIVGHDELSDIAVIKIELRSDFKYTPVIWGTEPFFGDDVYVIGHPQGMVWTLSKGVVGNPKRYVSTPWQRMIQSDVLIMPGNSGGPLFNMEGELIGINTLMVFAMDPKVKTQAWAFSVHIDDVKWAVDRIIQYGDTRRPALNIEVDFDDPRGLVKIRSAEGTPLRAMGFDEGFLISIDGIKMKEIGDIFAYLKTKMDGEYATIRVEVDGKEKEYTFALGRWDDMIEKKEAKKLEPKVDPNIKIIPAPNLHGK